MRNYLILAVLFTLSACTSHVETNLPEPETTTITTDQADEVTLRSTTAECEAIENQIMGTPTPMQAEDLLECRLNEGTDETEVANRCTFSEQWIDTVCLDPLDIVFNYSTIVSNTHDRVEQQTSDCTGCNDQSIVWGCRAALFTVTYLNDTECPNAPDDWEFEIVADVYCCE